ncbi:MAG TPA: helix-hairpin-helix domain-containing protein [Phaeodactylibacter sp.]|nr:helix-hairpin-helix domain-containing protein [Phaeodactylibacter sp.]
MYNGTLLLASLEPCWLWWLILSALAFILGAILGCLLCRNRKRLQELEEENTGLQARATNWEKDYNSLKYQHEEAQKDLKTLRQKLNSCEADKAVLNTKFERLQRQSEEGDMLTAATPTVLGARSSTSEEGSEIAYASLFQSDNLQIVEGIGPKIESTLKVAGITNWALLAAADEAKLRKILTDDNPNLRIHNPRSWPEQARLAEQDKWEELIEYQKFLDAGKAGTDNLDSDSKLEKMAMKVLGFSSNPEDLTIVEGIGPKIEQLLKNAGIDSWQALAKAPVERLRDLLQEGGTNYKLAKPDTWPQQAALAAAGKWGELQELQDRLQGGIDRG